jgi:AraC-like DNA-binding protein
LRCVAVILCLLEELIFPFIASFLLNRKISANIMRIARQGSFAESIGLRCWRGSPNRMGGSHWHNDVELNLVETGSVHYLFGSTQATVPTGGLAVFWGAIPHQLADVETSTAMSWLTLPLSLFLHWQLPEALVRPVLHGLVVVTQDEARFAFDLNQFGEWERDLGSRANESDERCKLALLEIEARLRRLALVVSAPQEERDRLVTKPVRVLAGRSELSRVEQMTGFIAQHYQEPLQIAEIARSAGLHPNYAMTLFRRQFGLSLTAYLTQYRVSHAQRLLATTDDSILQIALASGFGSASRFYAVFKRICGQSPGEYRASLLRSRRAR